MANDVIEKPTILIDLKKYRIRIHRHTLKMLGDPPFIQLMVNPQEGLFVVGATVSNDPLRHKVRYDGGTKKICELYCSYLIGELNSLMPEWEAMKSYHITGEYIAAEKVVRFRLSDSVLVLPNQPETGDGKDGNT